MSAQKPPRRGVFGAILGTLAFSVIAGLLVTAMVTPAIAVSGVAVNSSIGVFDNLPDYISIDKQPQQNRIYANQGAKKVQIATVFSENREEVSWTEVSQFAKDAAVEGEDRRFYQHGGIDPAGIIRAAVTNFASGGIQQGASTITQQLVKNTFVQQSQQLATKAARDKAYNEAIHQTFARKLKEMKLAISLEKKYTKDQILLGYLNIAGFGGNTYGIQAAAEEYYSTTAAALTPAQAASLVAIVQEPALRSLDNPKNYAANKQRRDVILGFMKADGKITAAQYATAVATPVDKTTVKLNPPRSGCVAANAYAKWFCDYVTKVVLHDLTSIGATDTERAAAWKRGGYDIYTSLDLNAQTATQNTSWKYAPKTTSALKLGEATTSVEVGTGRILTMAENKDFNDTLKGGGAGATAVNYATNYAYGGSNGFQGGSTYKAFTLLDWLANGHGLSEVVDGSARTVKQSDFTDSCPDAALYGSYKFRNDEANEGGPVTVKSATARSINGAFISMAQQLDLCDIKKTAESLGVTTAKPYKNPVTGVVGSEPQTNLSSVIGTNTVSPLTMAAAYAGIASGGIYCKPTAIDSVVDASGKTIAGQPRDCKRGVDQNVANTAIIALSAVMTSGTGTSSNPHDGTAVFGKTGTTDDSHQTWTVGSSSRVATAVWVGNIAGNPALSTSKNPAGMVALRSVRIGGIQAALLRHSIWRTTMKAIDKIYPGKAFTKPDDSLIKGSGIAIPSVYGKSVNAATLVLQAAGFNVKLGGVATGPAPVGPVVKTNPSVGTTVSRGYTISIYTSDGSVQPVPTVIGMTQQAAEAAISAAGFTSPVAVQCRVDANASHNPQEQKVTIQNPSSGGNARPDATITIVIAKPNCP